MSVADNALTAVISETKAHPYNCIYAIKEDGVMKVYIDGVLKHEYSVEDFK